MNDIRTTEHQRESQVPHPVHGEFEELLGKAEDLLEEDVVRALGVLMDLQKRYVASVRVFDLMGEALLRQGKTEAAFRHKALHEVLRGVYKAAIPDLDERGFVPDPPPSRRADESPSLECSESMPLNKNQDLSPQGDAPAVPSQVDKDVPTTTQPSPPDTPHVGTGNETLPQPPYVNRLSESRESPFPVTVAMAHELLRQGHFQRAREILTVLSERYPGDPSIQEALESSMKKFREKQLLGVFQRWLKNIEMMKSPPPS